MTVDHTPARWRQIVAATLFISAAGLGCAATADGTSEHVCTLDTTQRIDLASSSLRCRNGRPRLIGSAISLGENRFQRRVGDRNGNRRRRDGRRGGRSKSHGASRHGPSLFLTYRAGQCPDDDEGAGGYHQSWQLHALVPVRFHSDCPSIRLPLLRPPARRPLERCGYNRAFVRLRH